MQKKETALLFATITTAILVVTSISTSSSSAYLKIFSPKQGQQVPAGSFLQVIGTSTPSNATHTRCNVQLQTNQNGYKPVSPLGPAGTYTTWKGTTSEPVKVGVNHVEGQLLCFGANGTPNLIKHFVRNFTGIQANSGVPITPTLPH